MGRLSSEGAVEDRPSPTSTLPPLPLRSSPHKTSGSSSSGTRKGGEGGRERNVIPVVNPPIILYRHNP